LVYETIQITALGLVARSRAGLLDTQFANDLDMHNAAQIQCFPPPKSEKKGQKVTN
jgi:hypothetical protein